MSILKNSITSGNSILAPGALIAQRDPNATDKNYDIGQVFINTLTDDVFTLTSFTGGVPNWEATAGGGASFTFIDVTTGPNSILGTTSINATGTAATTIGNVATGGVVTIESSGILDLDSDNIVADTASLILRPTTTATIAPTATVTTIDVGNVTPTVGRTTTINGGAVITAVADVVSIAPGGVSTNAGASKTVNIAPGATLLGAQVVNIGTGTAASGTNDINIGTGTGGGTKTIDMGNIDGLTVITAYGDTNINTSTSNGDTIIGNKTAGGQVTLESLTNVRIDPVGSVTVAPTATVTAIEIGNISPTVNRTTTINGGAVITANTDIVNVATGGLNTNAGAAKTVNIASGANLLGTTTINIGDGTAASGTHDINIGTGTGGGTKRVDIGNVDGLTTITELGIVGINNTGTATTTIGSTAAGAVAIGSSAASNFTVTGVADLTLRSTAGAVIVSSSEAAADAIQLTASDVAGGVTSNRSITVSTAGAGIILPGPVRIVSGTGSPSAVVTAPQGSMYLRTDGSGVNDRAYINTNGATAWTAIVTVA